MISEPEADNGGLERHPFLTSFLEGWSIFRQNLLGRIGMVLLVMFALMALCSYIPPWISPIYDPMTGVDPNITSCSGPCLKHWLGTDFMGRDILSQLLAGARIAFMVGISAAVMSIVLGVSIGMTAGYMGRFIDTLLMRLADMIMVMPTLLVSPRSLVSSTYGPSFSLSPCSGGRVYRG